MCAYLIDHNVFPLSSESVAVFAVTINSTQISGFVLTQATLKHRRFVFGIFSNDARFLDSELLKGFLKGILLNWKAKVWTSLPLCKDLCGLLL